MRAGRLRRNFNEREVMTKFLVVAFVALSLSVTKGQEEVSGMDEEWSHGERR